MSATPVSGTLQQQWGEVCLALCTALEAGDEERFLAAVDALTGVRERALWESLRALDERLRAALDQFRLDPRLLHLAGKEIPDARARLDHVLRLTDEAAHRTLDLVESSTPLVARTAAAAAALRAECAAARASAGAATPISRELLGRLESHFAAAHADGETVKTNLVEVLMAQGYQDLSGQIIRRVIELVAQLEDELARLVQGHEAAAPGNRHAQPAADPSRGFGPAIPGINASTVEGQQDVDELLALGVAMKGA